MTSDDVSSLLRCLFRLYLFLVGLVVLSLSYEGSSYIWTTNPLLIRALPIFSPSLWLVFRVPEQGLSRNGKLHFEKYTLLLFVRGWVVLLVPCGRLITKPKVM